jgi:hypothetical protein
MMAVKFMNKVTDTGIKRWIRQKRLSDIDQSVELSSMQSTVPGTHS